MSNYRHVELHASEFKTFALVCQQQWHRKMLHEGDEIKRSDSVRAGAAAHALIALTLNHEDSLDNTLAALEPYADVEKSAKALWSTWLENVYPWLENGTSALVEHPFHNLSYAGVTIGSNGIDFVDSDGVIYDWKTTTKRKASTAANYGKNGPEIYIQAKFYAAWAFADDSLLQSQPFVFYYIGSEGTYKEVEFDIKRDDCERYFKYVVEPAYRQMRSGVYQYSGLHNKFGRKSVCNYCDFEKDCEARQYREAQQGYD